MWGELCVFTCGGYSGGEARREGGRGAGCESEAWIGAWLSGEDVRFGGKTPPGVAPAARESDARFICAGAGAVAPRAIAGGESGVSCAGERRLGTEDLRGTSAGGLVGDARVDPVRARAAGLAGDAERVDAAEPLEEGGPLAELARSRPLALGTRWWVPPGRVVGGGR